MPDTKPVVDISVASRLLDVAVEPLVVEVAAHMKAHAGRMEQERQQRTPISPVEAYRLDYAAAKKLVELIRDAE